MDKLGMSRSKGDPLQQPSTLYLTDTMSDEGGVPCRE